MAPEVKTMTTAATLNRTTSLVKMSTTTSAATETMKPTQPTSTAMSTAAATTTTTTVTYDEQAILKTDYKQTDRTTSTTTSNTMSTAATMIYDEQAIVPERCKLTERSMTSTPASTAISTAVSTTLAGNKQAIVQAQAGYKGTDRVVSPKKTMATSSRTKMTLVEQEILDEGYETAICYLRQVIKGYGINKETLDHYLQPTPRPRDYDTVEKLCKELTNKNPVFFENLCDDINKDLTCKNAKTIFFEIGKNIYADGTINWGRIMAFYVFSGTFAMHFAKKGEMDVVTQIPHWIMEIFETYLLTWIAQNGGWQKVFNTNYDTLWKRCTPIAAVVGLGVGITAAFACIVMSR